MSVDQTLRTRRNATAATFLAAGIMQSTWFARIPSVGDALGLPVDEYWYLIAAFAAGAILGLMIAPVVSGVVGNRSTLLLAAALLGPMEVIVGVCADVLHSPTWATIAAAVFSLSFGLMDVSMNIDGVHVEHTIGRNLMPLFHAFYSAGALAGSVVSLGIVAAGGAALPNFALSAIVGVAVIAVAKLRPSVRHAEADAARSTDARTEPDRPPLAAQARRLLRTAANPAIALLALVAFCFTSSEGSATNLITLATEKGHHLPAVNGSVSYAVFMAAMMLTRFIGGRIADRLGRHRTLELAAIIGAVGVTVYVFGGPVLLNVGAFLWGVGCAVALPLTISMAGDGERRTAAIRVSVMSVSGYAATFVSPPAVDLLAGVWGLLPSLLILAALFVVALSLIAAHRRTTHAHEPLGAIQ